MGHITQDSTGMLDIHIVCIL